MRPTTITGRAELIELADRLLAAVRPFASPGHARLALPGTPGGYGSDVDELEAYARTFLLAGFRLAGEEGRDPAGYAEGYARGLGRSEEHTPERQSRGQLVRRLLLGHQKTRNPGA